MKSRLLIQLGLSVGVLLNSNVSLCSCNRDVPLTVGFGKGNETTVSPSKHDNNNYDIVGVDQFGRSFEPISGYRKDRQVGMFYWPWIGQPYATGIYDATKILSMPNGLYTLTKANDPAVSPDGQMHYWGEPLWGYYNSDDEWVIRKQMQMLTIAGVDFIFFDTTNALIYTNVALKVCAVIDEMLKDGWNAPKVVFYTHSHSFQTLRDLYQNIYFPQQYPNTWYRVNGKPMIIAYTNPEDDLKEAASRRDTAYTPGVLSPDILSFFHFVKPQWPSDPAYEDGFPWVEWTFPQPYHSVSKVMNVTVASHPMVPMSFSLTRPNWINWGRGWNAQAHINEVENVDKGTFFQAQWDRAITADPPIISVGGWNEWIAYKQMYDGEYMLCDAVNKEYSRDIEPMSGGYEDAYYLQLISNIHRYKGIKDVPKVNAQRTVDIAGSIRQWDSIPFVVRNVDAKYMPRDAFGGSQKVRYVQPAPANKIEEAKVTHDLSNVYFYIKGKQSFTEYDHKTNWLNILIGTGTPKLKKWECYEYVIGKSIEGGKVSVDAIGKNFESINKGYGQIIRQAGTILIAIPRSLLGLTTERQFYFKIAMGVTKPSDIMNYYLTGSSIPMGRLSYLYRMQ